MNGQRWAAAFGAGKRVLDRRREICYSLVLTTWGGAPLRSRSRARKGSGVKTGLKAFRFPALAFSAVVAAGLGGTWYATRATPLLVAEPLTAVFEAAEGETVSATFTIRNVSDQPVRILGAPTSCGCTVLNRRFPVQLEAGESSELTVSMLVGKPDDRGVFSAETFLLVNRKGQVPTLIIQAHVTQAEGGMQ